MAIRYDQNADLDLIRQKSVAVVGYGAQGRAQALNLRDSGVGVTVALYSGSKSWSVAENEGFGVVTVAEATQNSDVIMMLAPDTEQPRIYRDQMVSQLRAGQTLMFSHGFNIRYATIEPPGDIDVSLVSPKGPGKQLRDTFVAGEGLAALLAVHQDVSGSADSLALSYACAIGAGRAGVLDSTFREETETDLFGEQAVLCGGVVELVKAAFQTLIEAGYQPEVAYFECFHELKLVVDLMHSGGLAGMRKVISDTAEWGGYVSGPRVVGEESRRGMAAILSDIQDGSFAREWIAEDARGRPKFQRLRTEEAKLSVERIGASLRQLMCEERPPGKADGDSE